MCDMIKLSAVYEHIHRRDARVLIFGHLNQIQLVKNDIVVVGKHGKENGKPGALIWKNASSFATCVGTTEHV